MTDQKTDLSPRELDAALAERLFGWPIRHIEVPHDSPNFLEQWIEAHVPRYSTTGDGMLLVLEAMRERGYCFEIRSLRVTDELIPKVQVSFYTAHAVADTLPRAVALPALAALDKEAEKTS